MLSKTLIAIAATTLICTAALPAHALISLNGGGTNGATPNGGGDNGTGDKGGGGNGVGLSLKGFTIDGIELPPGR